MLDLELVGNVRLMPALQPPVLPLPVNPSEPLNTQKCRSLPEHVWRRSNAPRTSCTEHQRSRSWILRHTFTHMNVFCVRLAGMRPAVRRAFKRGGLYDDVQARQSQPKRTKTNLNARRVLQGTCGGEPCSSEEMHAFRVRALLVDSQPLVD